MSIAVAIPVEAARTRPRAHRGVSRFVSLPFAAGIAACLSLFVPAIPAAFGQVTNSTINSGDWFTPGIWSQGSVPNTTNNQTDVRVQGGHVVTISGAAAGVSGTIDIGRDGSGEGRLTIDGAATTFTAASTDNAGTYDIGTGGTTTGRLDINGGIVQFNNRIFQLGTSAPNLGIYRQNGGTVSFGDQFRSGNSGTGSALITGGQFATNIGGDLICGTNAGSFGVFGITGGLVVINDFVTVGNLGAGFLGLGSNGRLVIRGADGNDENNLPENNRDLRCAVRAGAIGSVTVGGNAYVDVDEILVCLGSGTNNQNDAGQPRRAIGVVTVNGGSILSQNLDIGTQDDSSGTYIQTGGHVVLNGDVLMADQGFVALHTDPNAGGGNGATRFSAVFGAAEGFFNMSGGTMDVGSSVADRVTGVTSPNGIFVDSTRIYWSSPGALKRANRTNGAPLPRPDPVDPMAPNITDFLLLGGLSSPQGIWVDDPNDLIYWVDAGTKVVQRANIDHVGTTQTNASNLTTLVTGLSNPFGIHVSASHIYWTDNGSDKIQRADVPLQEITNLTCPAASALPASGEGGYFDIYGTGNAPRRFWFNVAAGNTAPPLPPGGTLHVVNVLAADASFQVATKLDVQTDAHADFTSARASSTVVVTSVVPGIRTDALNVTAGISVAVAAQGQSGGNVTDLIATGPNPHGISVTDSFIYWIDRDLKKIQRANLNGSGVIDLITGLSDPIDIFIRDFSIYWTDSGTDKIHRADLDGSNVTEVVSENLAFSKKLTNPHGIFANSAFVYWTDNAGKIQFYEVDNFFEGLFFDDFIVGERGSASAVIGGDAELNLYEDLVIGRLADVVGTDTTGFGVGKGTVRIQDNARVNVNRDIAVGFAGVGTLNLSSGAGSPLVTVEGDVNIPGSAGGSGLVTLEGGTLHVKSAVQIGTLGATAATISQTGGALLLDDEIITSLNEVGGTSVGYIFSGGTIAHSSIATGGAGEAMIDGDLVMRDQATLAFSGGIHQINPNSGDPSFENFLTGPLGATIPGATINVSEGFRSIDVSPSPPEAPEGAAPRPDFSGGGILDLTAMNGGAGFALPEMIPGHAQSGAIWLLFVNASDGSQGGDDIFGEFDIFTDKLDNIAVVGLTNLEDAMQLTEEEFETMLGDGMPFDPMYQSYYAVVNGDGSGSPEDPFFNSQGSDVGIRFVVKPLLILPPENVSASDAAFPNRVAVTWDAVLGAANYEVWRNTVNDEDSATHISSGDDPLTNSYDDTTAVLGITYFYWLKARNGPAVSSFSDPDTGSLLDPATIPFHSITEFQYFYNPTHDMEVSIETNIGFDYTVESSPDLELWTPMMTVPGDGNMIDFMNIGTIEDERYFFRIIRSIGGGGG